MMRDDGLTLGLAGLSALALAAFQLLITFSPDRGLYLGVPETLLSQPILMAVTGLILAFLFAAAGLYGLSGAGLIRRLPQLRAGLVLIGLVLTARGFVVIPPALATAFGATPATSLSASEWNASVVALAVGLLFVGGTSIGWHRLAPGNEPESHEMRPRAVMIW
jgi:hypothetical protein